MLERTQIEAMLGSELDSVEEGRELGGGAALTVRFCPPKERGGYGRVVLRLTQEGIRVDSTSTATGDFLGCADAYARAATFVRALGVLGVHFV